MAMGNSATVVTSVSRTKKSIDCTKRHLTGRSASSPRRAARPLPRMTASTRISYAKPAKYIVSRMRWCRSISGVTRTTKRGSSDAAEAERAASSTTPANRARQARVIPAIIAPHAKLPHTPRYGERRSAHPPLHSRPRRVRATAACRYGHGGVTADNTVRRASLRRGRVRVRGRRRGGLRHLLPQLFDVPRPARHLSRGPLRRSGQAGPRLREETAAAPGAPGRRAPLRPRGVGGPELERAVHQLLQVPRRHAAGRVAGVSADGCGAVVAGLQFTLSEGGGRGERRVK